MKNPPFKIGNAELIAYLVLNNSQLRTGNTEHYIEGEQKKDFYGLAICKYESEGGYYLFYCGEDWEAITDTWHETIEDAREQAGFEYMNTGDSWIYLK